MTETAAHYNCPICGSKTPRDLAVYLDHANTHIIDEIKKKHPQWVADDGTCTPCMNYYKQQLSGESAGINMGPKEIKKRFLSGIFSLTAAAAMMVSLFLMRDVPGFLFTVLFILLWTGFFGLLQARTRTCALLAAMGVRNMDSGNEKIRDKALAEALKRRSRKLILISFAAAAALTLLSLILKH